MKSQIIRLILVAGLVLATAGIAYTETPADSTPSAQAPNHDWVPVTGVDTLRDFMSGLKAERELANGEQATAEYNVDGTGMLHAWGASIPRTWEVKGNDQLCITAKKEPLCYTLEKKSGEEGLYRVRDVITDKVSVFRVTSDHIAAIGKSAQVGATGGAAAPTADEMAKELANPNTPLATLNLKLQYRTFKGDLPHADDQDSTTLLFQPSMPFPLANGDMVFFRPAIPLLIAQPVFESDKLDFDSKFGLGDIAFDLAYGRTTATGILFATGLIASLPTATKDELGTDRWTLGPELLLGKLSKTYVLGAFPNHQWDVGGSGDANINLTTAQVFGIYLPGGGWNVGTSPILSYDHEAEEWAIPLNFTVGKTVILNGRPWKFAIEINYFVQRPDVFGPEWFVGFNVAPVVENALASWLK